MADVNANIGVNIDTSNALAQLKALQRQISQFHTSISKSSEAAALAQRDLQRNFINSVNSIGAFSAELRTVRTTAESFTDSLEKNKFSMREYFRFAGGATKTFGRLFKSEFDTINKVAEENVKRLQTQYIKMGRDASGAMRAIAIMPNELDMSKMSTQLQMAAQRQALFNQLVKQGSTNLLNFGKNTQWAGRQLMVGFTLPLIGLGTAASKTFMDMETAALKFRKVYGDLFTPTEEREKALADIQALGESFTKYGIAVSQTVSLAADAAAAGFQGLDLQRQVTEATRLQVLGQVDQQKALETTISLQNAFQLSSADLADSINFLNAVENQTVISLDDITTAIPKAAPVVKQLGGNVKDLAFFMAAMKEGGINASEGANALKSGLASLINPTDKAREMMKGFGIDIDAIVNKNAGNVKQTVIEFATALDGLSDLNRQRAIEQLFGKFQLARLSTLFENVTKTGNQASRVLDLANASASDLAATAESELGMTAESSMNKFRKAVEDLKLALVPVGQVFLESVTPILEFVGNILEKFNNMSAGVKKAITIITVALGAIAPVALMTFGLIANFVANGIKGLMKLREGYLRLSGQSQILGAQTQYLTVEQQNALAVAHSLDQSHARLVQTFTAESTAVQRLSQAYERAIAAGTNFARINPGMMRGPIPGFKQGILSIPGSGTEDKYPAMLAAGEAVIPAKQNKKYAPLIQGIIADNIPGFKKGTGIERAHATMPFAPGSAQFESIFALIPELKRLNDQFPGIIRVVSNLTAELPVKLNQAMKEIVTRSGKVVGGVGIDRFKTEYGSLQDKFTASAMRGGADINNPAVQSAVRKLEVAVGERAVVIAQGTKNQKVTDAIFAQATQDVIEEFKLMDAESRQVAQALDRVAQQVGQIRIQPSQAQYRQGLSSGVFNIDPSGQVARFGNVDVARPMRPTKGGLPAARPASNINLPGNYTGGRDLATYVSAQSAQVANEAILATAKAAGTQSPSRKTIPIGEDIARGLQVGMANQMDETRLAGENLSNAAVSGTQSRKRRIATSPGGEVGAGGVIIPPIVPVARGNAGEDGGAPVKQTAANLYKLNSALMATSFAFSSISGIASAFGGRFQGLSEAVFKISTLMFGLMSVVQLLTQEMFLNVVATRANKVATAMGAAGGFKGLMAGATGFGSKLLTVSKFLIRFAGPIGAVTAALTTTFAIVKMVNAARERERKEIMGLADAANMTSKKLKTLGDFFGIKPTQNPMTQGVPQIRMTAERRGRVDELKASESFKKDFKDDIAELRKATTKEAEITFKSVALSLSGQGFAPEMIKDIIDALREEAGKTDVKFDLKSLDLKTEEGQSGFSKLASDITNELVVAAKTGYKEVEVLKQGIYENGAMYSYYAKELKPTIALQRTAAQSGQQLFNMMTGLAGGLNSGAIGAKEFNKGFNQLEKQMKALEAASPGSSMLALNAAIKLLEPETQKLFVGINNSADAMLMLRAQALGLTAILPGLAEAIKMVNAGYTGDATALVNAQLNLERYKKMILDAAKVTEEEIKKILGGGTLGNGEKSAFQKAIEQLKQQREELKNTITAYNKLKQTGMDTAKAFEYAKDPIIAAALATTKVGTAKWKELLALINEVDKKATQLALKEIFDTRTTDLNVKKEFVKIVPLLQKMGLESEDIQDILSDPNLMAKFVKDLSDGTVDSERIKTYIEEIPEIKRVEILLGIREADDPVKKMEDQLSKIGDRLSQYFTAQANKISKPFLDAIKPIDAKISALSGKILGAQTRVNAANKLLEPFQNAISAIETTIEQKRAQITLGIEQAISAQTKVIDRIRKQLETQFDKPIAAIEDAIKAKQREIELRFDRPIAALQEEASDLSNDLAIMDRAAEEINKKYDAQEEALNKISEINQDIINQQKSQIGLADALSRGDIAAAAQAAQEMRAQAAEAASRGAGRTLQAAREAEIAGLRSASGMTRAQIEERQFEISQKIYQLEEQREQAMLAIRNLEDELYNLQLARSEFVKNVLVPEEEKLATLEEQRVAALEEIERLELSILKIKQSPEYQTALKEAEAAQKELERLQNELRDAQLQKEIIEKQMEDALTKLNEQKADWEAIQTGIDNAKGSMIDYNTELEKAKTAAKALMDYILGNEQAPSGSQGQGTPTPSALAAGESGAIGAASIAGQGAQPSGGAGNKIVLTKQLADTMKLVEVSAKNIKDYESEINRLKALISVDSENIKTNTQETQAADEEILSLTAKRALEIERIRLLIEEALILLIQERDEVLPAKISLLEQINIALRGAVQTIGQYLSALSSSLSVAQSLLSTILALNTTVVTTHIIRTIHEDGDSGNGSGSDIGNRTYMYGGKIKNMAIGGIVPSSTTGYSRRMGSDYIPILATPGEFVVNKFAAEQYMPLLQSINESKFPFISKNKALPQMTSSRYGLPKGGNGFSSPVYPISSNNSLSAPINNASAVTNNNSSNVYNYSVGINVAGTSSNANDIAKAVMNEIKYIDSQRVRGQRVI